MPEGSAEGRFNTTSATVTFVSCFQATNPFAHEEMFEVRIDDPFHELHLVTDASEWRFLREVGTIALL